MSLHQYVQQINTVPPLNKYSTESVRLLKTIYEQASAASQAFAAQALPNYSVEEAFSSDFKRGTMYNSVDHIVKTHMESANSYSIHVVLNVAERVYRLFFVFPMKRDTITAAIRRKCRDEVDDFVVRAHIWLSVASHYASNQCSKTVDVYLYMTELKKTLPVKGDDILDTIHANTAFTTSCQKTTEIILYRREELSKVFIHESFHNMGLDFSAFADAADKAKVAVQTIFPVSSRLCVYETYCEMWAEIVNVVIEDVVAHPRRRGFETAWPAIAKAINMERRFTMFQVAKVLTHNDMNYNDLMVAGNKYREKTEIFCYYILKSIMMFHCDAFLSWCAKNNPKSGLQFDATNAEKYVKDLVVGYYKKPEYLMALNKTHEHFVKNRTRMPALIRNTMRMTALTAE
jgi:hypothetical protein